MNIHGKFPCLLHRLLKLANIYPYDLHTPHPGTCLLSPEYCGTYARNLSNYYIPTTRFARFISQEHSKGWEGNYYYQSLLR
jgi:hypothetical protein